MPHKSGPIYRHGGPVDKLVQIKLSTLHNTLLDGIRGKHNAGDITVYDPKGLTDYLVSNVEEVAATVITMTIE